MYRITARETVFPNTFDIYVANIKVSSVLSYNTREEVEARFQPHEIWLRFYKQNETLSDTDLEITSTIGYLQSAGSNDD